MTDDPKPEPMIYSFDEGYDPHTSQGVQPKAASVELNLPFPADWTLRETQHFNGGSVWFGYGGVCDQEPRLGYLDTYLRKDRSVTRKWKVDGQDCDSAEQAWERLKLPATFTPEEIAALGQIGDEPIDRARHIPFEIRFSLAAKGAISYAGHGQCCRTDTGRAALAESQPQ